MNSLWTGVLLALRIGLAGEAWLPAPPEDGKHARGSAVFGRAGRVVVAGVLVNLLGGMLLAQAGWWTPLWDWIAWGALLCLGVWRNGWRNGPAARLKPGLLELGLLALTIVPILVMPPRSEWLAGGWDPGLYQNNAIAIAARDGLGPATDTVYADMSAAERELFSRSSGSYHEVLPGVPMRLRDGALPLFFFHLTPICGAWFYRLGGVPMVNRLPTIVSMLGVWVVLALFRRLGFRGWQLCAGAVLWGLAPMWWYQQAIPTSEPLYILLMCGGVLFYLDAVTQQRALPVGAVLCAFAATVNHFNVAVVGCVLLFVAACAEAATRTRGGWDASRPASEPWRSASRGTWCMRR